MSNSAVFSTLCTHTYSTAVVSHDFLTGAPFHNLPNVYVDKLTALRDNRSTLEHLSNAACLKAYRSELVPDRLDVLAASSATSSPVRS